MSNERGKISIRFTSVSLQVIDGSYLLPSLSGRVPIEVSVTRKVIK